MNMKIIPVGSLQANCYIVYNEKAEAVIIDPGSDAGKIMAALEGLTPAAIILTHSHFDHVLAAEEIRDKYNIPVAAHENERRLLENDDKIVARPYMKTPLCITADIFLKDGEKYTPFSEGEGFLVLHTPGHTEGGASYYMEELNAVFTGDTLFRLSIGRSDFPTGDHAQLIESIKKKLFPLGDGVTVYPGHGDSSTIKNEKANNPFM